MFHVHRSSFADKRVRLGGDMHATKRFGQVTKRFGQVTKRFGQVTKRFGQVTKRFDQATERFGQVTKRFDQATERFDQATKQFGQMAANYSNRTVTPPASFNISAYIIANFITYNVSVKLWLHVSSYFVAVGGLLNLLLLAIILSRKRFRTQGPGILIAHVALLDLIIGSAYFPFNLSQTRNDPQPSTISCNFGQTAISVLLSAKYYSVLFLAVNRFFALTLPRAYRTWSSPRRSYLFVLTAWLIGTSVYVPSNLLRLGGTWASAPPWGSCGFRGDGSGIYEPFAFAMTYIPTVLAIAIYGVLVVRDVFLRMGRFLGRGQSDIIPVGALTTSMQRNRRWTRILVVMTFCEALCIFAPSLFLAKSFRKWVIAWPPLGLWIRTVGLCSFWVNPVSTLSSA
ncbi:hypothetical protein BV898_16448 [Hypsibius exemplaris]|uniref:G-protein coupled receptors family 1 profile domain-containing protein n=1 Tax=Hypsibius exemplaris TaxID=2072580 RepID=A0A9X6NDH1_HYPEX|nr:hypothetical protein BV898_16448 [Hypsibius exemplaris]